MEVLGKITRGFTAPELTPLIASILPLPVEGLNWFLAAEPAFLLKMHQEPSWQICLFLIKLFNQDFPCGWLECILPTAFIYANRWHY